MKFTSTEQSLNAPVEKAFQLCGNCKNLCNYLSPQVTDVVWEEDSCTFTIQNMAKVTLTITEKVEFEKITYTASNDKNIPISLTFLFKTLDESHSAIALEVDLEVPVFLKPMVKAPMEDFVQRLVEKLKMEVEK